MPQVPGMVYRVIATHLVKKAGLTHATAGAGAGAVTLIQRFGSALSLNIHLMCMDARMRRSGHCQAGDSGAEAQSQPRPLPRCVCPQQQTRSLGCKG